jgi:uncharacterized protein
MKKNFVRFSLIVLAVAFLSACKSVNYEKSSIFPERQHEWINDYANLITPQDAELIETLCRQIYDEELATVVLCTMERIPKVKKEYESAVLYGTDLLNHWGVGRRGVNDGVLILVSAKDRNVTICTSKLAEHILPDSEAGRILDNYVVPGFRTGEYGRGIIEGLKEARKVMIENRKMISPEKYGR